MSWYDLFSSFYDLSTEPLYRDRRAVAAEALDLAPGSVVLDLPTGTGQSLGALSRGVGPTGRVIGVDLSAGMAARARARAARDGLSNVVIGEGDAARLGLADLERIAGAPVRPDRLHIFLGLSVMPDFEACFANLWELLAPGGRAVVVDTYAERPGLYGRFVELFARADITRRVWEPLQARGVDFERRPLRLDWRDGGELRLHTAVKPKAYLSVAITHGGA